MAESIHNLPIYAFTVEAYHKLVDVGILKEEDRVELIEGQIVQMTPIKSTHAACVDRLGDILRDLFIKKMIVRTQNPITLGKHSEPEPDLAIVAYQEDYYEDAHPIPNQVYLAIEVAKSTEQSDREIKIPLYAKYNIQEAWLVNLNKKEIEVYQKPTEIGYSSKTIYSLTDKLQFDYLKKPLAVKRVFRV